MVSGREVGEEAADAAGRPLQKHAHFLTHKYCTAIDQVAQVAAQDSENSVSFTTNRKRVSTRQLTQSLSGLHDNRK